jgi:hypothetical protein
MALALKRLASELDYNEERLGALELKLDTVERNLEAALAFVTGLDLAAQLQPFVFSEGPARCREVRVDEGKSTFV